MPPIALFDQMFDFPVILLNRHRIHTQVAKASRDECIKERDAKNTEMSDVMRRVKEHVDSIQQDLDRVTAEKDKLEKENSALQKNDTVSICIRDNTLLYICIHMCVFVCMFVCVCVCVYMCVRACMCVCMRPCVNVYMCVYTCVPMSVHYVM